jgi:cell division cycle 14
MKHYGYTAKETIAWCRICRPGSVVGPQQQYLATIEARMWSEGERYLANNLKQTEKSIRGRDKSESGNYYSDILNFLN